MSEVLIKQPTATSDCAFVKNVMFEKRFLKVLNEQARPNDRA